VFNLPKVQRECSVLEAHVKPYIDASNTDTWKHVLRVLYLNGSVLRAHEDFKVPCLISQIGSVKKVEKSMDLLSGKSKTRLVPLVMNAARMFLPKLLQSISQLGVSERSDATQLDTASAKAVISVFSELDRQKRTLMGMIIDGAFTVADLAAIWFFKGLADLRGNHILSGISEDDYENMIDGLRRLDVLEPKLQVSLCPECMNYELTISRHPSLKDKCPRCGTVLSSQTLYMFKGELGNLKSENSDMPLFVSSYLKFRLYSSILTENPEIYPKAETTHSIDGDGEKETSRVEIDVYIPSFGIGIECKILETPLAPMTTERANGIVGDLMKQLRKYIKAGISEFFLVTNVPDKNLGKVQEALEISVSNAALPLKNLKVIPGDVDALLNFLNELADRIGTKISQDYMKRFEKKLPEPITIQETEAVKNSNPKTDKAAAN